MYYSLCPTQQDYENGKIKRKLSIKVSFACANCLLAILVNYIPTRLMKCDESPDEIMETRYSFVTKIIIIAIIAAPQQQRKCYS